MASHELKKNVVHFAVSLWIVPMYHAQTRAPWQTLINGDWSNLEHFHHNVILHNDNLSYTTTFKTL